mgnify:CR=1 FL=1
MKLGEPTLDQLRIFLAVAEHGSFGGAAKASGRAVSAISYGIAQLEAQLGLSLFDREGSRRPVLTPAGEGLLAEARGIAAKAVTPFLLNRIFELTEGRSLAANIALVLNNARLAAAIARHLI